MYTCKTESLGNEISSPQLALSPFVALCNHHVYETTTVADSWSVYCEVVYQKGVKYHQRKTGSLHITKGCRLYRHLLAQHRCWAEGGNIRFKHICIRVVEASSALKLVYTDLYFDGLRSVFQLWIKPHPLQNEDIYWKRMKFRTGLVWDAGLHCLVWSSIKMLFSKPVFLLLFLQSTVSENEGEA